MPDVIINADDYAMDQGVDDGILRLAAQGRVSASSVMVLSPRLADAGRAARDGPGLSWGLHLDLTSPFVSGDFSGQSLPVLMARAQAGLLGGANLRREVDRQLSAFEAAWRAPPDFVDGHQHVHHLPAIRDVLLDALGDRYAAAAGRIGLRICMPRQWRGMKAAIIAGSGSIRLAQLAAERGHPVNSDFAGVYDFAPGAPLGAYWQSWVAKLRGPSPMIMCHVAARGAEPARGDPIRQARHSEFDWLASEEFQALCQRFSLIPVRWPQV